MNEAKKPKKDASWSSYWPLICLILVSALEATALQFGLGGQSRDWMHFFMGLFLCQFSLLKLFDIQGFADGFQMYDLLAKQSRGYALAYPFIELFLGLGFLSFIFPTVIYALTAIVMIFGSVGVLLALRRGIDMYCPCMGNVLRVPLSTVTLTEDLGMGLMALALLIGWIS